MNHHIKSLRAKYKAWPDDRTSEAQLQQRFTAIRASVRNNLEYTADHFDEQAGDNFDGNYADYAWQLRDFAQLVERCQTPRELINLVHSATNNPVIYESFDSNLEKELYRLDELGHGRKNLPNDPATDARLRQEFNELRDDIIERIQGDLDYPQCWTNYDRDSPPVRRALQRVRSARSPKELLDVITASDAIMQHYDDMRLCGSDFDIVRELNRLVELGL